jgi:hypothetical protein
MPKLKKISAKVRKARVPKEETIAGDVLDDRNPADVARLNVAMAAFINAICRDVLEYSDEERRSWKTEALNLNVVHDRLNALKAERDNWRTRCESIEAAFNLYADGAQELSKFAPAAIPEKVSADE